MENENNTVSMADVSENLKEENVQVETIIENEAEPKYSDEFVPYDVYEGGSEPPKKKKFRFGTVCIIAGSVIALILILVASLMIFKWVKGSKVKDDPDETPMAVVFLANEEDSYVGDLYISELGGKKEKVASGISRDRYQVFGDNNLLYVTEQNDVYLKRQGMTAQKIASGVYGYQYMVSENENAIFCVSSDSGDSGELYIYYLDGTREKIDTGVYGVPYAVSADGKRVYYNDGDGDFCIWTAEGGKEKIASNAYGVMVQGEAFSYRVYNDIAKKNISYIKLANEADAQKIDNVNMSYVDIAPNGLFALYLDDCSYDGGFRGELYLYIKASTPIKIASDVAEYSITEDSKYVYIRDKDGVLYVNKIPDIDEKTYMDFSGFRAQLDENERIKLASDVVSYRISPNGRNVAILDVQKDLYVSVDCEKAVKVSADVKDYMVFDSRICFLTGDDKLYLNSRVEKTDAIKENNKLIAVNAKKFAHSKNGKYIAFYDSQSNALNVCIDGRTPETLVTEANTYDYIYYKNQVAYENIIEIDDFVGKYKNDELGYLFEIRKYDEEFVVDWYTSGVMNSADLYVYNPLNRYGLEVGCYFDEGYFFNRLIEKNGVKWFGYNNTNYAMMPLSYEEFEAELQKQRAVEEHKEITETRREMLREKIEILEEKGSEYYRRGVDVTTTTPIYSDHDRKYLRENIKFVEDGHVSVSGYYVSVDGTTLWLRVYGSFGRSGGEYIWIIAK